jgi:hypothetical protein
MVDQLRAKPGSEAIGVTVGDFATTKVGGTFSVAYLVYNTIMNLTTQAEQVACFRNAAEHLEPGGCFVIEVLIPELRRLPAGQKVVPYRVSSTDWAFDIYDVATQATTSNYISVVDGHGEYRSIPTSPASPLSRRAARRAGRPGVVCSQRTYRAMPSSSVGARRRRSAASRRRAPLPAVAGPARCLPG